MGIDLLDRLAARAWPAPVVRRLDGWLLRAAGGVTRRANSALPEASCERDVGETLADAAGVNAAWDLPLRVQVTEGARAANGLDEFLAARAFVAEGHALLATAEIDPAVAVRHRVEIAGAADAAWIDAWWHFDRGPGSDPLLAAAAILGARLPLTAHARVEIDGRIAAVGRGVVASGWLGVFAMATAPEERGRGLARSLLGALLRWGSATGAERAYLQVTPGNAAARHLYRSVGFAEIGRYHYRTAPKQPT